MKTEILMVVTPEMSDSDFERNFDAVLDDRKQEKELKTLRSLQNVGRTSEEKPKYQFKDAESAIIFKQDNDQNYW